jgi:hypothetical protein
MKYQIIENLLPKDIFLDIKNFVMDQEFPWFYRGINTEIEGGYFSHSLFNNHKVNSNAHERLTKEIYEIINPTALIEVRANLMFSSLFYNKKSRWHVDYDYGNYTAILYLNTTEGGTEIKNGDKIDFVKAEENKMVIMKSFVEHRAILSPDTEKRYILNFNYFSETNDFSNNR